MSQQRRGSSPFPLPNSAFAPDTSFNYNLLMATDSLAQSVVLVGPASAAPADVSLWSWPLRDEPARSRLGIALALLATAAIGLKTSDPLLTLLAGIACVIALVPVWLPVHWELGLTGVRRRVLGFERRIAWLEIARFEATSAGIWFYADREADPGEGCFIPYGTQGAAVKACVHYYLCAWTSAGETTTQSLELPI